MQDPLVLLMIETVMLRAQETLGARLLGLHASGSLALRAFDVHSSDIDLVAITDRPLDRVAIEDLRAMHHQIGKDMALKGSKWSHLLEMSYIPLVALRRYDPGKAKHPSLYPAAFGFRETFGVRHHGFNWVMERWILREVGIGVLGPCAAEMIDPISADDLREAIRLLEPVSSRLPETIRLCRADYQAYLVLTMCRLLHTYVSGVVWSKPSAARWAQSELDRAWVELIDVAMVHRGDPKLVAPDKTIAFIRHVESLISDAVGPMRSPNAPLDSIAGQPSACAIEAAASAPSELAPTAEPVSGG